MTDLIKELKALKEKATPGPWKWSFEQGQDISGEYYTQKAVMTSADGSPLFDLAGGGLSEECEWSTEDFELIVALVNHLPTILAKLEEGERMREALEGEHVREVLSMMCFQFIGLAKLWRDTGTEIQTGAEVEQAFFMQAMLPYAIKHGSGWRQAFHDEQINPRIESARRALAGSAA